jgi:hypothetical protein
MKHLHRCQLLSRLVIQDAVSPFYAGNQFCESFNHFPMFIRGQEYHRLNSFPPLRVPSWTILFTPSH